MPRKIRKGKIEKDLTLVNPKKETFTDHVRFYGDSNGFKSIRFHAQSKLVDDSGYAFNNSTTHVYRNVVDILNEEVTFTGIDDKEVTIKAGDITTALQEFFVKWYKEDQI